MGKLIEGRFICMEFGWSYKIYARWTDWKVEKRLPEAGQSLFDEILLLILDSEEAYLKNWILWKLIIIRVITGRWILIWWRSSLVLVLLKTSHHINFELLKQLLDDYFTCLKKLFLDSFINSISPNHHSHFQNRERMILFVIVLFQLRIDWVHYFIQRHKFWVQSL